MVTLGGRDMHWMHRLSLNFWGHLRDPVVTGHRLTTCNLILLISKLLYACYNFLINNNTLTLANSYKIMIHSTVTIGCGLLGGGAGITLSWFSIIFIIYISHYQVSNLCIILSSALSKSLQILRLTSDSKFHFVPDNCC